MQKRTLIFLLAATLFGCAEGPVRQTTTGLPGDLSADERAEMAMQNADYHQAIELYSRLAANSTPPLYYEYRYRTAEAMFRAGLVKQAKEHLATLPVEELSPSLRMKVQLLEAEIPLKSDPDATLALLLKPAAGETELRDGNKLFARYHQLRARAFAQQGNHLETAREYIMREFYLVDEAKIQANQMAIWQSLSLLTPEALRRMRVQPPPDVLSGWLELVSISKDYTLSPRQMQQRIIEWRNRYTGHPAMEPVLEMLAERSQELSERPANLALLLPLSGRYANAAQAIQEGLLAAYYDDPYRDQITIRVYDIGEDPQQVDFAYQQAVYEGAEFIIGPLDKEAVERLAMRQSLPVPTLALNYAGMANNPSLYQFSLAPEDEAREVAERAWSDGHTKAAMLLPKSSLGDRLAKAFSQRWQELGGTVVSHGSYDARNNDFSAPIKSMLNINDSEFRKRRITALMREPIDFIPRRRQDIDFIFISAFPRQARLIRPQLKFHHAGDLPLLATSHLYSGELDRNADRDMDDILFCDMPWTLRADSPQQALRQQTLKTLQGHRGQLQRLVALGLDAYQLIPILPVLESHPYEHHSGETGKLRVNANHRIERQLLWAQFKSGIPRLQEERVLEHDREWQQTQ